MSYKCIRARRGQAHGREDRDLAQTKTHTGLAGTRSGLVQIWIERPATNNLHMLLQGTNTQSLLRPRMGTFINDSRVRRPKQSPGLIWSLGIGSSAPVRYYAYATIVLPPKGTLACCPRPPHRRPHAQSDRSCEGCSDCLSSKCRDPGGESCGNGPAGRNSFACR